MLFKGKIIDLSQEIYEGMPVTIDSDGLLVQAEADDVVFGELFRLRQPAELLREFDMYEACGEGSQYHFFNRKRSGLG